MNTQTTLTIELKTIENADPVSKVILEKAQKGIGMVPNIYAAMAHNPALLTNYAHSMDSFRTHAGFTPQEQEVLFISISVENNCTYCVAAHSFLSDNVAQLPKHITDALRNEEEVPHEKYNALNKFSKAVVIKRGMVSEEDIEAFLEAGYTLSHIMGVVAAVGAKTLSNYFNHIFHAPVDAAFLGRRWSK